MKGRLMKMFIKIGEQKINERETVSYTINKETEKAIQLHIIEKIQRRSGEQVLESDEWLPKSQIKIINNEYINAPDWLLEKKGLRGFNIIVTLDSTELKEKTGLWLPKITPEQEVQLLQQGYAKIQ